MKTKFRTLLSLSLAAFMFLSACSSSPQGSASDPGADQSAPVSQNPVIPDSGDGPWYAGYGEPEYGGEIVFASNRFTEKLDIYNSGYSINFFFLEPLFMPDWTVDRNEYGFTTNFIPTEYYKGCLAESYEQPDLETVIVHLRQDVYWQDKEPVNGRQFVANDVVYHYSRLAGIGPFEGQDPSPQCGARLESIESITELDTFTVEFKFKEATPNNLSLLLDQDSYNYIMAPEVIDAGLGEDWEYAVGTGPWILTEMIPGNMVTFEKNPNYWGYDERYPENRLPYADTLKVMSVSESSTKLASLRTGQIDFADELTLQQYEILAESDTDLLIYQVPFIATNGLQLNMTHEPFDDINVRKALQMAIDRETMAAQYFGGTSPIPAGWVNPYTDVAANAWYYNAVGYATANGLMSGTGAATFAPNDTMNRAMVWTVIARLAGQSISGESWAADAQAWAVAQGVSDGTNPDGAVSREQLVTMLYRYAGSPAMNVPELALIGNYPDSADVSGWAESAFAWAISKGVIEGRDGQLAAGDSVTRAEAATILARFHMLSK